MKKNAGYGRNGLTGWLMPALACTTLSLPLHAADLASCGALASPSAITRIEIGQVVPTASTPHGLLGANILYTVDDSDTWRAGLDQKLQQLEPGSLRFPGGEIADGYDWESGRAEITPNAKTRPDNLRPISYLEFLKYAASIKAKNIYFVVNVEGAFKAPGDRESNLRNYAHKAARLVEAVKKQAYKVAYWEIGNESYQPGTSYPLKATEYAQALKVFSAAMRKADPSIRILANGPGNELSQGFADRLSDEQLSLLRSAPEKLCGRQPRKACLFKLNEQTQKKSDETSWWGVLLREAPEAFDDLAIHSYSLIKNNKLRDARFYETERIQKLKAYVYKMRGREAGIAVTEWNAPPAHRGDFTIAEAAISNAIKFGNYLAAGVQDAVFWPLRYPTPEDSTRALLSMQGLTETPMLRALQLVNVHMRGQFVAQEKIAEGVYGLKTSNADGMALMLVNASDNSQSVVLDQPRNGARVLVRQLAGEAMTGGQLCAGRVADKGLTLSLPPKSITTANFTP